MSDFDYVITGQTSPDEETVGPVTLEQARRKLALWLAAEDAVTTGQEYTIGQRTLRRVDVKDIADRINYWEGEVMRLRRGGRKGARVFNVIPRDN